MAKKFVRGVTDIEDIESYDKTLTNVNDILSDGEDTYVHTKKGKNESYYKLTDSLKSITSDNSELITVSKDNTTNTATLHPKHDAQKEQSLESTRSTLTIQKGTNGTSETTKVDTNPQKVLEHDNLLVGNGLTKQHTQSEQQTTLRLSDNVMNIIDNTIKSVGNITSFIKDEPYNNLNTVPTNTIITYSDKNNVENCPSIAKTGFTIITFTGSKGGSTLGGIQICFTPEGRSSYRIKWYYNGTQQWSEWKVYGNEEINNYPLGLELFENIAVIGDSYSSGELYPNSSGIDYYNISWIQLLARKHGLKATNYSRGGLQTRTWLTSEYGLSKMQQDTPKDLYFIYLGINDANVLADNEIGTLNDIVTNADTFYGNYAKIINNVMTKAPNAKIAIINMHNPSKKVYQPINQIAQHFNLPVLDLSKNTLTNSSLYTNDMREGHPQALGYATLAGAIEQLLTKSFNDNKSYWINYIPQTTD